MNNIDNIDQNAALIVIDVQEALDHCEDGPLNNPEAEHNILKLIEMWRTEKRPLFFVQYHSPRPQSPFNKDAPYGKLKEPFRPLPGESLIIKQFENAFMQTTLETQLRERNIRTLIFTGFFTDQCVASSAKVANNLGFHVMVLADGTGTTGCTGHDGKKYQAEDIHQLTLGGLQRDDITIMETSHILNNR